MEENKQYEWQYCSIGGVVGVKIDSGEAIAHLGELDQKKWTVLSCPTKGLEFDSKTLEMLDTDGDGRIRVPEMVAAAQWLTSVIKDKDLILKGDSTLPLAQINTSCDEGKKLYKSAKQILANLGTPSRKEISIADTDDTVRIFAKTAANGDGIITAQSSEFPEIQGLIKAVIEHVGSAVDRSGEPGVDAEMIEKFYAACAAYAAWCDAAEAGKAEIYPYGADTPAALAACEAVSDKVADYFMRCKLIAFDSDAAGAVDVNVEKIGAISALNLATQAGEIALHPLARPCKEQILPFEGINPAWQAAFDAVKALVLDVDFKGKGGITEAEWNAVVAKFAPYKAWMAAKAGTEVEPMGIDAVRAVLKDDRKQALLDLVEADKALKEEADGIDAVGKLLHYYRDFSKLLHNYVNFSDFYSRDKEHMAIFEEGRLFVDKRCCELCIRVENMGAHADMAAQSGMFLIYCTCTSKVKNETMDIVAVMTAGGTKNLKPGKNGIFYDRDGQDWDTVITKVVDNPISVREAFWRPYRKFANFITDKINKSAEEKDANAISSLQGAADGEKKQPFDVAKFAGIFAALGMAVGALGVALAALFKGIMALKWWQLLLIIAAIMLVISGPSCFIAWSKLRKRNLGPVLNANGWAINTSVLVNILFGGTLTSVAKYPKMKFDDPLSGETPAWKKWLWSIVGVIVVAFAVLFFTNSLAGIGLPFHKEAEAVEAVEEASVEEAAPAAEAEAQPEAETPAE